MRILALLLLGATLPAAAAFPSDDPLSTARLGVQVYDDAAGIRGDSIQGLTFDDQGRLWVATSRGVVRFEGQGFVPVELPGPARDTFFRAVVKASDGSLYFGLSVGGVLRLRDGVLTRFDAKEGLPHDRVNALIETKENGRPVLYAGTYGGGLARFDGARFQPVGRNAPLPRVWALFESEAFGERTLVVGGDNGLFRKKGEAWVEVPIPEEARTTSINSFAETVDAGGRKTLWAGSYGRGVVRVDAAGARLYGAADGLTSLAVTSLAVANGTLFAGTRGAGVQQFDGTRFSPVDLGGKAAEVFRLASDDEGSLWIGTRGDGLLRLKSRSWHVIDTSSGLPGNHVWALAEATRGGRRELWVGTSRGAAVFRDGRWVVLDSKNGLPAGEIASVAVTTRPGREPVVWIGTHANGLVRIEGKAIRVLDKSHGFFSDRPTRLASLGDTLWIGTEDQGVARLEGDSLTLIPPPKGEVWNQILGLVAVERRGESVAFVGVRNSVVEIRGDKATRVDSGSLTSDAVVRLADVPARDGVHELWTGFGGTIGRLREGETRFTPLVTHGAALPKGTIYQIVADRRGRVYVGSPEGFARLSLRDDGSVDVVPLTRGDELPADASDYASYLDSRGRVFLATTAGLAVVDPEAEVETPRKPRPLLLETARSTAKGTRLVDGTTLAYDDSGVTFALTLLDYAADQQPLYQTWLEGLESGPGSFTSERAIRFTSLPAGDYVFHATGLDHRGVVSAPVALRFRVGRSPLRTPLAYAIYALAAVLLVGGGLRVHEAALVRKNRALETLVEARTREVTYARDEALAGNRAKSAFLASMSHELRTPLSAIIGYAEMLQEDLAKEAPEAAADLGKIEAAARHQLRLVNEILDLSKVEAGRIELDLDDVNLDSLLEDAATSVAPLVEKNGNRLVVDVPERLGVFRVDALRVRQILFNLLSNASKFTKEGTITLSGRLEGDKVVLAVADTGIGVTAEQLSRLFKPFTQADAAVAARYGGTGLGLTIAKSFCELMGGSISATSEPGKGSTFTVRLPRSAPAGS